MSDLVFDTECMNDAICPWCGEVDSDAWEWFTKTDEPVKALCESCNQPFQLVQITSSVVYSTHKLGGEGTQ